MGLFRNGKCKSKVRLDGKTAVVTGGNNGIGYETSLDLLRRGARVILACRSIERGNMAAERLVNAVPGGQVRVVHLNLASLKSVKQCAEELLASELAIHLLINNAGMICDKHTLSEDGFEITFQTNHLGHYLLTCLLLDKITRSAPSRIINVSSVLHLRTGVTVYALHPGGVNTDIIDDAPAGCLSAVMTRSRWALKTPEEGAQTTLHCALAEELAEQKGLYYSDCKEARTSSRARNKESAAQLWHFSEEMVDKYLR